MKRLAVLFIFLAAFFGASPSQSQATQGSVLGIHILHPTEAEGASELLKSNDKGDWHYVTLPLSLDDLHKQDEWQTFLHFAKTNKLIPIVRLVTRFDNGVWKIPTKKDVIDEITFLSSLEWPVDEHYIIVFNEVNHDQEWGGKIDPPGYADMLRFTSDWAKSEDKNYQVLPAAMDLATPTNSSSLEAFAYFDQMRQAQPDIFSYIDFWNSHSYPNPGFSSPAQETGRKSISGFVTELSYLKDKTGKDYRTFITETGWMARGMTSGMLNNYYDYAAHHVWSDPRVVAVTPFVLQGDPGPFSGFTFIDKQGRPTPQYEAYQNVIRSDSSSATR